MLPQRNFVKYIWTSPDGKTHNQIHHILIERRWHSSILNVRFFRWADCDTDHYLVLVKVREILALSKLAAQKFAVERFNLRKLDKLKVRKQYQIKISNRFADLENLREGGGINRVWESIKNVKKKSDKELGLYKLKQHKTWFDEEWLGFLEQMKLARLQLLQNPNQNNLDNLHNVRRESSKHFRNNRRNIES